MKSNQKIKKLKLNKEVISKLNYEQQEFVLGGAQATNGCAGVSGSIGTECIITQDKTCLITCDSPGDHCDFPTINDTCFTFKVCNKCNDYVAV